MSIRKVSQEDLLRCCLYIGSASAIRWHCASFSARRMAELRRKTAKINWGFFLKDPLVGGQENQSTFRGIDVRVKASKSKLYHTAAIRERVLLGIYESFGYSNIGKDDIERRTSDLGASDDNNEAKDPSLLLDVRIERDQVEIFLNAFPTPLHQRGYRHQVAKAPLREDLAYGMLFSAGWIPSWIACGGSDIDETWTGLLDPFCGSGTIVIEGAAMAAGMPPGRLKETPFKGTVIEDASKWKSLVLDAKASAMKNKTSIHLSASDRDAGAIQATIENAKRAGVWKLLEGKVHQKSLSGQPWFEHPSRSPSNFLVVTNPPFGKRVSHQAKLLPLYQTLGHSIWQLNKTHSRKVKGVILTDNSRFLGSIGPEFRFESILRTSHGGLKVLAMALKVKLDENSA